MAKTHTNISESSSLKETELQSQIDALSSLNVTPFFFHTYLTFLQDSLKSEKNRLEMDLREAKLHAKSHTQELEDISIHHRTQVSTLEQEKEELGSSLNQAQLKIDQLKDQLHDLRLEVAENNGSTSELIEKNSEISVLNNKVYELETQILDQKELAEKFKMLQEKEKHFEKMLDAKTLLVDKLRENIKSAEDDLREQLLEEHDNKLYEVQQKYEEIISELEKKLNEKEKSKC